MSLNRTYEALEASRAGARTLVEQAPDAVFVADLSGRYIDVNDAGCRMLGYSRDEILAMTIVDLLAPEDAARLPQQRERLLQGVTKVGEWTLRRKDGGLVPVEISAKIFPDGRWQAPGARHQRSQAPGGASCARRRRSRSSWPTSDRRWCRRSTTGRPSRSSPRASPASWRTCVWSRPSRSADSRPTGSWCTAIRSRRCSSPSWSRCSSIARGRHLGPRCIASKQPLLIRDVTPAQLDEVAQSDEHRRLLRELGPTSLMALPLLAHGGVFGSLV